MNALQFNEKLGHLIQEVMNTGVGAKLISVPEVVGVIEMHKAELLRWSQDQARQKAVPLIMNGNGVRLPKPPQ